MNLKIKKVFCLTLIFFMGMSPFMAGAVVEMCSGNVGCPFCSSHHMGSEMSARPLNLDNSCCAGTEACDFEDNQTIDIAENLISALRTDDYGFVLLMPSSLDSIISPPHLTGFDPQLANRAAPFSVPIFLQNLSFIC